jgi:hypothetical protein
MGTRGEPERAAQKLRRTSNTAGLIADADRSNSRRLGGLSDISAARGEHSISD